MRALLPMVLIWWSLGASAATSIVDEPDGASYHLVTHYRVGVDAPAADVWEHLIDLKSWMHEFDLVPIGGEPGEPGAVLRLYEGQDFRLQILQALPGRLLVVANLPSEFEGEASTGLTVFSLVPDGGSTVVDLTMSRRYTSPGIEPNPQRITRSSAAFQQATDAMWRDRFLERLRCLAEGRCSLGAD